MKRMEQKGVERPNVGVILTRSSIGAAYVSQGMRGLMVVGIRRATTKHP